MNSHGVGVFAFDSKNIEGNVPAFGLVLELFCTTWTQLAAHDRFVQGKDSLSAELIL